jgi:hypothetical protein
MGDAEAWRRWNAWRYVLEALEEIAPEALEDLARLVPVYQEAAPHMDRRPGWYYGIIDWESLEEAIRIITVVPGLEESLAKLRDFREALLAWGRRWNLAHPEPLSWAIQNFPIWAKAPVVAGGRFFTPAPWWTSPHFLLSTRPSLTRPSLGTRDSGAGRRWRRSFAKPLSPGYASAGPCMRSGPSPTGSFRSTPAGG